MDHRFLSLKQSPTLQAFQRLWLDLGPIPYAQSQDTYVFSLFNQYVIKLFVLSDSTDSFKEKIGFEQANLEALAPMDLKPFAFPHPLASGVFPPETPFQPPNSSLTFGGFILMTQVPGQPFAAHPVHEAPSSSQRFQSSFSEGLHRFHHAARSLCAGRHLPSQTPLFDDLESLKDHTHRDMRDFIDQLKGSSQAILAQDNRERSVIHGDLHAHNIMIQKDGSFAGFVDLGSLRQDYPEVDLLAFAGAPDIYRGLLSAYTQRQEGLNRDLSTGLCLGAAQALCLSLQEQNQRILTSETIQKARHLLKTAVFYTDQLAQCRPGLFALRHAALRCLP